MRRVALMLSAVLVLGSIGLVAGPASAQKDKSDKKAAKIKNCNKDKDLNENIQAAFLPFFTGETGAERVENVENGEAIESIVQESTDAARQGGQTTTGTITVPVSIDATCDGKKNATFTYDLALNQPPTAAENPPSSGVGLNFAGDAVLQKGKWVISALTVCDLIGANPNTPDIGPRCQDAALG